MDYRYPTDREPATWGAASRNLAALRTALTVNSDGRQATAEEQAVLAEWSGWGGCASDLNSQGVAADLVKLVGVDGLTAMKDSTINAHYTPLWLTRAMWDVVARHAPLDRPVFEPGCGHGRFIGAAPDGTTVVGVEAEPASAMIARLLYPSATIVNATIESTPLADGSMAAAIGNVPFSKHKPYDPNGNPGRRLSLHNYCIMRALRAVRPGGVVALLTSRYTMDSQSNSARRQMAALADLVTAIRFPAGTFRQSAGTEVVIDLLVFVRRPDNTVPGDDRWVNAVRRTVSGGDYREGWQTLSLRGGDVWGNQWWTDRPDTVLGVEGIGRGMYANDEYLVRPVRDFDVPAATEAILNGADTRGAVHASVSEAADEAADTPPATLGHPDAYHRLPGSILRDGDRFFTVLNPALGTVEACDPGKHAGELAALCELRDLTTHVLDHQDGGDPEWVNAVTALDDCYSRYVQRYGFLNRAKTHTAIKDDEVVITRRTPPMGGFRDDPLWPLVAALEVWDDAAETAAKADLFTVRVVAHRTPVDCAGDPVTALGVCLADIGRVDIDLISQYADVDAAAVIDVLCAEGRIFHDPSLGRWVTAEEYLSGDVRAKLAAARAAANR